MRCIKIHINSFNVSDLIPLTKQKTKNSNKKTVPVQKAIKSVDDIILACKRYWTPHVCMVSWYVCMLVHGYL